MRAAVIGALAALALGIGACATVPAPVPVVGDESGLSSLTGEWGGEYRGETSGRSGSIIFKLAAGADTAFGDVVMIPRERKPSGPPEQDPSIGIPLPRTPEVLSIAFVRATGGGLSGRLTPYRDPECNCTLVTRFQGRIRGDVIEGTFTSTPAGGGATQTGSWKVKRNRP